MPRISVFDMLKIGIGPSSSHTMGPWRAAERFLNDHFAGPALDRVGGVTVHLYGSLAKTGRGHGTDLAVIMGLSGEDPTTIEPADLNARVEWIRTAHRLRLSGQREIDFDPAVAIVFHFDESLPYHPNGIRFIATLEDGAEVEATYYSIGGGFIVQEGEEGGASSSVRLPYPADCAEEVRAHCVDNGLPLWRMVWENEKAWRPADAINARLMDLWRAMRDCMYRGCHTPGELPGGLRVARRASQIHRRLIGAFAVDGIAPLGRPGGVDRADTRPPRRFRRSDRWVSVFALAVNEENASFGRVVTAPTNGAAGVIPAVLMYAVCFHNADDEAIRRFLMVAGEVGTLFKKGATISAALGGCQAEIGVSSSMAAAALAESMGATVDQALMAAEITMEHHLGLTCDPVGGLVQIPCIERNAMGAMKAITAATLALESVPQFAKVSLDAVIATMWQTAQDMSDKYKETAEGGLALQIPVNVAEC
ncbi:MAG: L-serine ammonia-lyase [Chloroflexi bacterium]|nr:L-serine ammonia-lyase [Chloroflexota bacterium]